MTAKQTRFVLEYLIDMNATQAAIRAGYSAKTANEQGARALANGSIKAAVAKGLEKIKTERVATAREVEEYLTRVLRGESSAEVMAVEGIGEGKSKARMFQKAPDERERLKAAEILAKRHGLLESKISIDGGVSVILRDDVVE